MHAARPRCPPGKGCLVGQRNASGREAKACLQATTTALEAATDRTQRACPMVAKIERRQVNQVELAHITLRARSGAVIRSQANAVRARLRSTTPPTWPSAASSRRLPQPKASAGRSSQRPARLAEPARNGSRMSLTSPFCLAPARAEARATAARERQAQMISARRSIYTPGPLSRA